MYSSPTAPGATGLIHPSSTNRAAPANGEPIGGTPEPAVNGALLLAFTVVSVGPYALTISRPGAHRSTTDAGHASPPTTRATESRPCGGRTAATDGFCSSTVTFSSTSKAARSTGEAATDSGTTTRRPPQSKVPHTSQTDTSKP